jgi:hypothetical protein
VGVKEIPLSASRRCRNRGKYVALVDDRYFDTLNSWAWSALVIRRPGSFELVYAIGPNGSGGKRVLMHREVWRLAHGCDVPVDLEIDHRNHTGLDNRSENLRLANRSQQLANTRKKPGTVSLYRGVYWHRRASKWAAQIRINNQPKYLGLFVSQEDAGRAYDAEAVCSFGEFARLNFPQVSA